MAKTVITESTKLDEAIVRVNKAANGLADAIQSVLAGAVYQAVHGRNTNHLNALIGAVGKGVRKTAIAQWVLMHAPVVLETDKEKAKDNPFRFSADKLAELLPDAANHKAVTAEEALAHAESVMGMHWTEHKEPPLVPEKWSAMEAVRKLLATGQQMQKKGVKVEGGDVLAQLAALVAAKGASEDPAPL